MRLSDLRDSFVLRRFFNDPWALLRRRVKPGGPRTIDLGLRSGGALRLRAGTLDRHIAHRIFARDEYRLDAIAPRSLRVVVDVGAHIGLFCARVAPLTARVIACEPSPENFALLDLNTRSFPWVELHREAVAARSGVRALLGTLEPSAHSFHGPAGAPSVQVSCVTLEGLFERERIERCDILKLDCEGAEHEILHGAPLGLLQRIAQVRTEVHPSPNPDWTLASAAERLRAAGHDVETVGDPRRPGRGWIFSER